MPNLDSNPCPSDGSPKPGLWAWVAPPVFLLTLWAMGVATVQVAAAALGVGLGPWTELLLGVPAAFVPMLMLRGLSELLMRSLTGERAVRRRGERLRELGIDVHGGLPPTSTVVEQENPGCP